MSQTGTYVLFHAHFISPGKRFGVPSGCPSVIGSSSRSDYEQVTQKQGRDYGRLVKANPLAQFPTLLTPEGDVMTEMVAIVLYLQHRHARGTPWSIDNLSPSQLAAFYRWFIFIPANVYPVLTIGEFPGRFVRVPSDVGVATSTVEGWVTQGAYARREELWLMLEREMTKELKDGQYLVGTQNPTLLDVLVAMMAHFMPHIGRGTQWFVNNCPRVRKRVQETLRVDVVRDTFRGSGLDEYLDLDLEKL